MGIFEDLDVCFEVVCKIVEWVVDYGILVYDIVVDLLVMLIGVMGMVGQQVFVLFCCFCEELKVNIICGFFNIFFGLLYWYGINVGFILMVIGVGMMFVIMNFCWLQEMEVVCVVNVLNGMDLNCQEWIMIYCDYKLVMVGVIVVVLMEVVNSGGCCCGGCVVCCVG